MRRIEMNADDLAGAYLGLGMGRGVCILDSCGVGHLGSHLMFAMADPVETINVSSPDAKAALASFERMLGSGLPVVFTLGYELGLSLNGIAPRHATPEPLIFASAFDSIAIHDYTTGESYLSGDPGVAENLKRAKIIPNFAAVSGVRSNFTADEYEIAVRDIQEHIRNGDTYQTNLTRKISAELPPGLTAEQVFWRVRKGHPAPFAALIQRPDSTVISASPERFFRVANGIISTSPIKGTRPRGETPAKDAALRRDLEISTKDKAENTMIVDLLRNDLGRVCEFGSVRVERLCEIEEHPTLFHLVSTISGELRADTTISNVIRALFPCGSITGAPKISTMRIIEGVERSARGLSMGAIGIYMPPSSALGEFIDASVAIRTMTVRGRTGEFNVGGGIVIDSDPRAEYDETVTKSLALLSALGFAMP